MKNLPFNFYTLLIYAILSSLSTKAQPQKRFGLELGYGFVYNPDVTKYEERNGIDFLKKNPIGSGMNISGVFRVSPKNKIDITLNYSQNNFKKFIDQFVLVTPADFIEINQYIRETHFLFGIGLRGEKALKNSWVLQPDCSLFILNWLSEEIVLEQNGIETYAAFNSTGTPFNPNAAEAGVSLGVMVFKKLGEAGSIGLKCNVNTLISAPAFFGIHLIPTLRVNF